MWEKQKQEYVIHEVMFVEPVILTTQLNLLLRTGEQRHWHSLCDISSLTQAHSAVQCKCYFTLYNDTDKGLSGLKLSTSFFKGQCVMYLFFFLTVHKLNCTYDCIVQLSYMKQMFSVPECKQCTFKLTHPVFQQELQLLVQHCP